MASFTKHADIRATERCCSPLMARELFRKARHSLKTGRGGARTEPSRSEPSKTLLFWKGWTFVTDKLETLITLYPHGSWQGADHNWKKELDSIPPSR